MCCGMWSETNPDCSSSGNDELFVYCGLAIQNRVRNFRPVRLKLWIAILVPLACLLIPLEWYPLAGMTLVEQRVAAIFFLAALFWILEPIPVYATSILVIVLELAMISDSAFLPLRRTAPERLGELLPYQDILAVFASPIIMLFLGGFFLAIAATKYQLDLNLARIMLRPFGQSPPRVLFGLMFITALFSMFMSNTATAAMMLSILMPILGGLDGKDRGRATLALGIPLAANIGGIGTPIGTPPNAIALKYLTGPHAITFSEWMFFALPFVMIMLLLCWRLLLYWRPFSSDAIRLNIQSRFLRNPQAYIVYVTFALTLLLWLTDFLHGMNAYVVAMIPVAVFLATNIITKEDLKKLNWDVLWLVAGGIALGLALERSGLVSRLIDSIPFAGFSPYVILLSATLLAAGMANFMSNTATANLLLPVAAALGAALSSLEILGGAPALVLGTALACSMGMALPISTPPNALAYASGEIGARDMARSGLVVGGFGLLGIYGLLLVMKMIGFFN
jgi:sodium-dependent dicarboxylate transporter 2/3/5